MQIRILQVTYLCCLSIILFIIPQWSSTSLIITYGIMFLSYVLMKDYHQVTVSDFRYVFTYGIIARSIALFSEPLMSDDIYRFLWDGMLIWEEIHPYASLPTKIVETLPEKFQTLYPLLNSPEYFSVYPPMLQVIFAASTIPLISGTMQQILVYKLIILVAEIGTFTTLHKLVQDDHIRPLVLYLYWMNPLVIIEGIGNGHPEIFVILGLSLFLFGLFYKLSSYTIIGAVVAISIKINPILLILPFIPIINRRFQHREKITFYVITSLALIIQMGFFLNTQYITNFYTSVQLYFNTFEFNASLYYLINIPLSHLIGYNTISIVTPILTALFLICYVRILYQSNKEKYILGVMRLAILTWVLYLFCCTTVHPWYILPIVPLAVAFSWPTILLWTLLIILSYSHYSGEFFEPNYILIAIEYIIVGYFFLVGHLKNK